MGQLVAANNYTQSSEGLTALGIYSSYNGTFCNHHHHWSRKISSWKINKDWSQQNRKIYTSGTEHDNK